MLLCTAALCSSLPPFLSHLFSLLPLFFISLSSLIFLFPPFLLLPCLLPPKVPESGELGKMEQFSDHYVVELSAVSSSGQDAIAAELKAFADQLKPYPNCMSVISCHTGAWELSVVVSCICVVHWR